MESRRNHSLYVHAVREFLSTKAGTIDGFFNEHEHDVVRFLKTFQEHDYDERYLTLAREFYTIIWRPRLQQPLRAWLIEATIEELVTAQKIWEQFFDLLQQVPPLVKVVGKAWIFRYKANLFRIQASLAAQWDQAYDAARLFREAAEELNAISHPTLFDRANASGNLAHACAIAGFKCLRHRPAAQLKMAQRDFKEASCLAKRGQTLLRLAGKASTPQFVWYLRYWQHVAAIGWLPTQGQYRAAERHVALAVSYLSRLSSFPRQKWYTSLEDLANQRTVIKAYEAFCETGDLPGAYALLAEWLSVSQSIRETGRYCRINVRAKAVAVLLTMRRDRSKARGAAVELERFIASRRSFGRGELYIRETIRALSNGHISEEAAIGQISTVFVLDSLPPLSFRYLDLKTEVERRFNQLPEVFWDWLAEAEPDSPDMQEVMYVFLLYVRCTAEFWCGVYTKRVLEGRMQPDQELNIPIDFSTTNWKDLAALIREIARLFDQAPALPLLADYLGVIIELWEQAISTPTSQVYTNLRESILEAICKTEQTIFPHPIFIEEVTPSGRGRIAISFKRYWRCAERSSTVTFRPRLRQVVTIGTFYLLKPKYKRIERKEDTEDLVVYPLHSATSFGVPSIDPVVLLVEGRNDICGWRELLDSANPHWRARILIEEAGGANHLSHRYQDLKKVHAAVVVVADVVGTPLKVIEEIRKTNANVFLLNPDFEGADSEALVQALVEALPNVCFSTEEVDAVCLKAKQSVTATIRCLQQYQRQRDGQIHLSLQDGERVKALLAAPLARKARERSSISPFFPGLKRLLDLGFSNH